MTGPEELLGIKFATLIAGFCGTLVNLSFCSTMGCIRIAIFLLTGMVTAVYIPPLLIDYGVFSVKAETGLGFLFGMLANQIMPGLLKFAKSKSENPVEIIEKVKKHERDNDSTE